MKHTDLHKSKIDLEGIYNLSPVTAEPYFGKVPCDCCHNTLAGDRYKAIGTEGNKHNSPRIDLVCCVDCFTYLLT